jgi:chemotaxis response regulator CheB
MPESAIRTGVVDRVLPAEAIADALIEIVTGQTEVVK